MAKLGALDTPIRVIAVDGEVVLDGPNGLGLSLTPDAAEESGRRLLKAAAQARRAGREGASAKA